MQIPTLLPPLPPSVLLLPALREGTRDLHERLESRLDILARLVSPDDYRTLLERFYGFYAPLEDSLASPERAAAWDALGIPFDPRRKAGLLASDLYVLGLTEADVAALRRCAASLLPIPRSAPELAGCAYVMEGATLGGQVIARHLERTLGRRPGAPGARFFHGYGARTGAMWQQFRSAVEGYAAREDAARPGDGAHVAAHAVGAARRTFAALEAWLMAGGTP